jgi:glyoxylase-like metal-dependent hydrolase (beta-lactamase superfamily II)
MPAQAPAISVASVPVRIERSPIAAISAYQTVSRIDAEQVTEDVHVLFGLGSNVGVLRTERGAAIVDTMTFRMQGEEIRKRVEALTGREVEVILNTHYHLDHTHGNPAFPGGSRVVSTKRTRELLDAFDADSWLGDAAKTLPNETFEGSYEIALGGKTIRAMHLGRGHTSGDMVVLFVEDRVIHLGDLFFNGRYPNIDLEGGGSVEAWIATLDRVLALDGFDTVIPGHGPVSDREGVVRFQAFLRELWEQASAAASAGKSVDDTLASVRLTKDAGFEPMRVPFVLNLDQPFVIRRAWEEASGAVKPQGPAAQPEGAVP